MALYAIGDLHLCLGSPKPMDVFGGAWTDYMDKLKKGLSVIGPEDTTVLLGDLSWALDLEQAQADFAWIDQIPGRKIILKGNHDYWWSTAAKFYKFCEERLGVAQTTAKRLIAINEHFCKNGSKLPEQYKSYGASKLAIMATFENGLEGKLQPSITVKQLDKLKKYYSSHEWHVDIQTTWRDDLKKFDIEQEENRLLKSARLLQRKFESAKETDGKPKGLVSDPYKAYTRFFDETLRTVAGLHSNNTHFASIVEELESVLKRLQGEVLKMQSNDMLDGL